MAERIDHVCSVSGLENDVLEGWEVDDERVECYQVKGVLSPRAGVVGGWFAVLSSL